MNKKSEIVDLRKDQNWVEKAQQLFKQGRLRAITGWTLADTPQIEELLQWIREQGPKKVPPDITFIMDLATSDLR
jgi:hypothetical protein